MNAGIFLLNNERKLHYWELLREISKKWWCWRVFVTSLCSIMELNSFFFKVMIYFNIHIKFQYFSTCCQFSFLQKKSVVSQLPAREEGLFSLLGVKTCLSSTSGPLYIELDITFWLSCSLNSQRWWSSSSCMTALQNNWTTAGLQLGYNCHSLLHRGKPCATHLACVKISVLLDIKCTYSHFPVGKIKWNVLFAFFLYCTLTVIH